MDAFPKDLIRIFALELNLPDLNSYCQLSKRFNKVIQNDIFWMNKFIHDFGKMNKIQNLTWKQFYQKVVTIEPNDLLWEGVENNQLSLVKVALIRNTDIENIKVISFVRHRPLGTASLNGYLEVVKYLVEQGADIHADGGEALRLASLRGHPEIVKYLVKQGADVHARGDIALRWASLNGHIEVIKYLVERGADIQAEDDFSLRLASLRGHLEIVKYLVEQGADIHAKNDDALRNASQEGHREVVNYLKSLQN